MSDEVRVIVRRRTGPKEEWERGADILLVDRLRRGGRRRLTEGGRRS